MAPRALPALAFVVASLLLPLAAHGVLEELWRVPLGLGDSSITSGPLGATTSDAYFAADARGTIFAFSTEGRLLWSNPGNSTLAALLTAPGEDDVLIAGYVTGASLQGAVIQALDATTGALLWSRTFELFGNEPVCAVDGYRGSFIFAMLNASTDAYVMTSYGLRHGEVRWTKAFNGDVLQLYISESVVVVNGFFDGLTAETLSPTSGAQLCRFNSSAEVFFYSFGGNVIFSEPTWGIYALFDTTTCAMVANLTDLGQTMSIEPFSTPNHLLVFGTDSQNWFLAVYGQDGAQWWDVTLPVPVAFDAGVPTAGIDGNTLYVGWGGVLAAFDLPTGAILWRSTQPVPVAPNPIPVIPMGHGRALVPNLQGYVLLDTNTQRVIDVNLHQPLTVPLWHRRNDGTTVVVVGEMGTGDLVALHNRWDPLTTVWKVPLAISQLPDGRIAAAQDAVNYYVADGGGVIFALEAASGRVLWSALGGSSLRGLYTLSAYPDRVFATMISDGGATAQALSAADGTMLWNVSVNLPTQSFVVGFLITAPAVLLLTVDIALPVLVAYSPLTGAEMWRTSLDGWEGSFPIFASNEIGFIQTLVEDQPTLLQAFNLTTGALICSTDVTGGVDGVTGTTAVVGYVGVHIISGTSCSVVRNLTTEFGPYFVSGVSSVGVAVLNTTENGTVALSLVGSWTTPVPIPTVQSPSTVTLVTNPADPTQLLFGVAGYFGVVGYFGAVDASTGALLWCNTLAMPFAQSSVSRLPVFPLGSSAVFLQTSVGYTIYDVQSRTPLRGESTNQIAATGYFVSGSGMTAPIVVFVDVASGSVQGAAFNA